MEKTIVKIKKVGFEPYYIINLSIQCKKQEICFDRLVLLPHQWEQLKTEINRLEMEDKIPTIPKTRIEKEMEARGFTEGNTGGNCTAFYFVFPDERILYLADECAVPTSLNQPLIMELVNPDGYPIETWFFDKVEDFLKAWEV